MTFRDGQGIFAWWGKDRGYTPAMRRFRKRGSSKYRRRVGRAVVAEWFGEVCG